MAKENVKVKADRYMRVCFGSGGVVELTTEYVEVSPIVAKELKGTPGVIVEGGEPDKPEATAQKKQNSEQKAATQPK